jgi:hypothetical protein
MSDTPRSDEMEVNGHAHYLSLELARTLERELAVARKGLEAVESLINESRGVSGLHLNGDLAPWDELRTGGRVEEWLIAFDDALNAARSPNNTGERPETRSERTA